MMNRAPDSSDQDKRGGMKHTLVALVENKPGVLNRVVSLFRRRSFNISSLTVGETENPEISRMTIVVDADRTSTSLVQKNLYKLVSVLHVRDVTTERTVLRDLALVKVCASNSSRTDIMQFTDAYRARVVDVSPDTLVIEISGDEDKINAFVDLMRPFGIKEMVRTGVVAMVRGSSAGEQAEEAADEQ
jgi:acetolactate synthase-1/3 small subunit